MPHSDVDATDSRSPQPVDEGRAHWRQRVTPLGDELVSFLREFESMFPADGGAF